MVDCRQINRATPRTQSALLEAMEERQVTADGATLPMPRPFPGPCQRKSHRAGGHLPAARGTARPVLPAYGVGLSQRGGGNHDPAAGRGRWGRVDLAPVLSPDDLRLLSAAAMRVHVAAAVRDYLVAVVRATRGRADLALGASPRATLALFRGARALACIRGQSFVRPDDIKRLFAVLGHRVIPSIEARLRAQDVTALLAQIASVPVPVEGEVEDGASAARHPSG